MGNNLQLQVDSINYYQKTTRSTRQENGYKSRGICVGVAKFENIRYISSRTKFDRVKTN